MKIAKKKKKVSMA